MLAYFDTNVFGHVLERTQGITAEDEEHLRAAIKSRSLSVLVGIHAIDETAAHPRDPVPQLRLIWELCDWDRIVKPADMPARISTGGATSSVKIIGSLSDILTFMYSAI